MDSIHFNRWQSDIPISYPYIIFKKEFREVKKIYGAFYSTQKFMYKKLSESGAQWSDKTSLYLKDAVHPKHKFDLFNDLKDWSTNYNLFSKWVNYMHVLSFSALMESYFAKILKLCLDSDVGLIVGCTKTIDGIALKKFNKKYSYELSNILSKFTKGDWFKRRKAFKRYFGWIPPTLADEGKIQTLEKIRNLRNDVAHTQGRDLSKIHDYENLNLVALDKISNEILKDFEYVVFGLCTEIDRYLLQNHIGNYHVLLKFHELKKIHDLSIDINNTTTIKMGVKLLQKEFGAEVSQKLNYNFYFDAVKYYENL